MIPCPFSTDHLDGRSGVAIGYSYAKGRLEGDAFRVPVTRSLWLHPNGPEVLAKVARAGGNGRR